MPSATTQRTPQQLQRLLTPDEVASYLRLTRTQVIRQARAGRIPALKLGKCYRFQLPVIEQWLTDPERAQ